MQKTQNLLINRIPPPPVLSLRDFIFAAKTVVDLADPNKDDKYHEYGCAISARFVVKALGKFLASSKP